MTRINVVPPSELCDKHLLAEYRELPRVFTLVRKAVEKGKIVDDFDIPKEYVLGKGHVTFFYDKLYYLLRRHNYLVDECLSRGFSVSDMNHETSQDLPEQWWNGYHPTPGALALNRQRIAERLKTRKNVKWTEKKND